MPTMEESTVPRAVVATGSPGTRLVKLLLEPGPWMPATPRGSRQAVWMEQSPAR